MSKPKLIYSNDMANKMSGLGTVIAEVQNPEAADKASEIMYGATPVLPLRDMVLFPKVPQGINIGRESSVALIKEAWDKKRTIFAVLQKDSAIENPGMKDLYKIGTICRVLNLITLPDGSLNAFVLPEEIATLGKCLSKQPYITAIINQAPALNQPIDPSSPSMQAILSSIDDIYFRILEFIGRDETQELRINLDQIKNIPDRKFAFMAQNSPLEAVEKQHILETASSENRAELLFRFLDLAFQKMEIKADIQMRTREDMTRQQKEMFLRQQIAAIQEELGGAADDDDMTELRKRADSKTWSDDDRRHFDKEIRKLERLPINSPDYSIQYNYLDTFLSLPWGTYSKDDYSLSKVRETLDRDHFGLDKVKERIVEHMAVLKLRGDMKAPILCLYGPPGVGKTSLGRSIAEAMGREYVRVSLGGLHDEAEIRGHRRTYLGSMPGRIIAALQKCGEGNPVFVLDEIDKVGRDFKGDPSTALLEVLDPEQNVKFHDNYIDHDYDLSKVLFIATANNVGDISGPLRDRMEMIEVTGYIPEEKLQIAERHLVPKVLEEHGFGREEIRFNEEALRYIIDSYTRESGVRRLEKKLAEVVRKLACRKASGEDVPAVVDRTLVGSLLGREEVYPEIYENNDYAGVVTGLAWTSVGGEILYIETSVAPGKGKLSLTGNLGDVMKESARIALNYLKAHAHSLGIADDFFENNDIHIHVPEGAVPKDGPSAGITMVTSLASAITHRKVRSRLAMTGETTLRGKVLPVGGIREKILAAKRAGITDIMLSEQNRKDIEDIKPEYLEGLMFHYVDRVEQVLEFALLDDIAKY